MTDTVTDTVEPTPREQLLALAEQGASVSAGWVLRNLEALVGEKLELPQLVLTPLDPIDVKGQNYPGMTDSEIKQAEIEERAKMLKPAPGAKPVKKAPENKITVT